MASVGDFGAWTLSAARPQPRRAGGGLSPERFGSAAEKCSAADPKRSGEIKSRGRAVVESEH